LFTYSERFNVSVTDLMHDSFSKFSVKSLCNQRIQPVFYSHALATLELLMIRQGLLTVQHTAFDTIDDILT